MRSYPKVLFPDVAATKISKVHEDYSSRFLHCVHCLKSLVKLRCRNRGISCSSMPYPLPKVASILRPSENVLGAFKNVAYRLSTDWSKHNDEKQKSTTLLKEK